MHLIEATLLDFRNLAEVQFAFSPGVNVLLGANGQGKTNVLEGLNYLALGRSFRGARDDELVRFGAAACHARLRLAEESGRERALEFGLEAAGERRLRVDGEPVKRKSDLVGLLQTVVFDPQTVELVRGGPEARRRWLDGAVSGVDAAYLRHLQIYNRALRQKSRLLGDVRKRLTPAAAAGPDLAVWNAELAAHAAPIMRARALWLRDCSPAAGSAYADLAPGAGTLELAYRPQVAVTPDLAAAEADEAHFSREISGVFDYIGRDELRRGRCLAGPHMDDFDIALDGVALRTFGSRGETRTAAVALKLAQAELVHRTRGVRPVLFFDDIFSELDKDRSRELQERTAADHQVFIATARGEDVAGWDPPGRRTWRIVDGRVTASP